MTDFLEKWAQRFLPTRRDEVDASGDLKFLREGNDALKRSGYLDVKSDAVDVMPDPVRALGGAGANFVGSAAAATGAPILGGALAGAGAAQLEGADAKGTAMGGLLGAAIPAAMKAPAAARGLFDRITAPGPELAMAGAVPSYRPPRGAAPAPMSAQRTAIAPGRGSIPPEAMPEIPKAGRTGFRPSQVPVADELAEAADVVHGDKMLGRELGDDDVSRFVTARNKLKANDVIPDLPPEPVTGTRASVPAGPRAKRRAKPRVPEQQALSFPEEPKPRDPGEWFERAVKTSSEPTAKSGQSSSFVETYSTPEGTKKVVAKPNSGAQAMEWLGIAPDTVAEREAAGYRLDQAIPGEKVVPPTFARDGVSYQEFVPNSTGGDELSHVPGLMSTPSAKRVDLLSKVARDLDKHEGNVRWTGVEEGAPRAHAIDNGAAFSGGKFPVKPKPMTADAPAQHEGFGDFRDLLNQTSPKKVAAATAGLPKDQARNTLGRLKELQYNPEAIKGLDPHLQGEWMAQPYDKRSLPTQDLMEIERLTGGIPSKHVSAADAPRLPVKPLEGEQLSLTDLLSQLR